MPSAWQHNQRIAEPFGQAVARIEQLGISSLDQSYIVACMREAMDAATEAPKRCNECGGTGSLDCDDPQCGDSTWDHHCNAGQRCEHCKGTGLAGTPRRRKTDQRAVERDAGPLDPQHFT